MLENNEEIKMENSELDIPNFTYRYEEMVDAIKSSIDNLEKVMVDQNKLIDLVEKSEESKDFEEFIKESKEQLETLNQQKMELVVKQEILTQVVDMCKEDEKQAKIISMLSLALGIFKN